MNTPSKRAARKWIGLAHVRPLPGNTALGSSVGAYANVVGLADDPATFVRRVSARLREYDFRVVAIEDVELFEEQCARDRVTSEIISLAESLDAQQPIGLGTFHAYKS